MRKYVLITSMFLAISIQARVLRVNNFDGSAPYSKVQDAVNAAAEGDTIMLDGSPYTYDGVKLDKRVVLIGCGYNLIANGIATEAHDATIYGIEVNAEGCVIKSLYVSADTYGGGISVNAPKVVITRCSIDINGINSRSISLGEGANNCVIHQNRIKGRIGNSYARTSGHQITNNLLNNINFWAIDNSYVAYNTSWDCWGDAFPYCEGTKFEYNIVNSEDFGKGDADNTFMSNTAYDFSSANNVNELKELSSSLTASGYGIFAGTDPFVISGVPSGPVIERLDVPTSAEAGGKMTISVKIGEAK